MIWNVLDVFQIMPVVITLFGVQGDSSLATENLDNRLRPCDTMQIILDRLFSFWNDNYSRLILYFFCRLKAAISLRIL